MASEFTSSIDFGSFYEMEDPIASQPLRLSPEHAVTQEMAWQLTRGQLALDRPVHFTRHMGGQLTSFLWSSTIALVCVHKSVVEILRQYNFTGWTTYPVEIMGRKGEFVSDYLGLAVTGAQLDWDSTRSIIVDKPPIVPTGVPYQVYKGLYFKPEDWDGSDFFWIRGYRVVNKAVKEVLKRTKVTNVHFNALTTIERDVSMVTSSTWQQN